MSKTAALLDLHASVEGNVATLAENVRTATVGAPAAPPLPPTGEAEVSMDSRKNYVVLRARVIEIGGVVAHEATKLTLAVAAMETAEQYESLFAATSTACDAFTDAVNQMALFTTSATLKRLVFMGCMPVLRAMVTLVRGMAEAAPQMAEGASAPIFATGVVHEACEKLSTALPTSVKMALKRTIQRSIVALEETVAEFGAIAAAAEAEGVAAAEAEGGFSAIVPLSAEAAAAAEDEAAAAAAAAEAAAGDGGADEFDCLFNDGTEDETPDAEALWRINVGVAAMRAVSALWRRLAAAVRLLPAPLGLDSIAWVDAVADGTGSARDRLVDLACALYPAHDAEELGGAAAAALGAVEALAVLCATPPFGESDDAAAASVELTAAADAVRAAAAPLRAAGARE